MWGRLVGLPGEMQPQEIDHIEEVVRKAQRAVDPVPRMSLPARIDAEVASRYQLPYAARELLSMNERYREQITNPAKEMVTEVNVGPAVPLRRRGRR